MPDWNILVGDCVESMKQMPEASIDAIVCDPPYGLEFMGREWDKLGAKVLEDARDGGGFQDGPQGGNPYTRGRVRFGSSAASMQAWHEVWCREAFRVLKPGGHLLAFGGSRTFHRLACAVEDAGFEIRDAISWVYASGFPKSMNVSMAIDRQLGKEPVVVGQRVEHDIRRPEGGGDERLMSSAGERETTTIDITEPASPEAEAWQGWGTALKPAWEPIVVGRKPLAEGTVAANVLKYGTGAVNIDATRLSTNGEVVNTPQSDPEKREGVVGEKIQAPSDAERNMAAQRESVERTNTLGRWPANFMLGHAEACRQVGVREVRADGHFPAVRGVGGYKGGFLGQDGLEERQMDGEPEVEWECVDGCPVKELAEQSGEGRGGSGPASGPTFEGEWQGNALGKFNGQRTAAAFHDDSGTAARFYFQAKPSRAERNAGLDALEAKARPNDSAWMQVCPECGERFVDPETNMPRCGHGLREWETPQPSKNFHPTVKPIALMRWLCRLVTPPGGKVLDPFLGSGTTGCAAVVEGFDFVGCELTEDYVPIAEARIKWWAEHPEGVELDKALAADSRRRKVAESGQMGLL